MNQLKIRRLVVGVLLLGTLSAPAPAGAEESLKAKLQGFQEAPAISTTLSPG